MRPTDIAHTTLFECFACMHRVRESASRECSRCGRRMCNIGMPRDL